MAKRHRVRSAVPLPVEPKYDSVRTIHGDTQTRHRLIEAATWGLLLCATIWAYWPALQGALLWDDAGHVTKLDLRSLHGLWRIWFELGATQQYYPLLHTAFWIEHRLWGDATLGYHLINVVLHATAAGLVVLIAKRLSLPGSWLAGFVFALHPVHVEAVAWISEQKSTLSGVFCLAAALVYLGWDQKRQKPKYLLASGLFVLALLSKSVTATLPAVLLVIIWWQRGRLDWKRDVLPLLPWFAAGITFGLFTAWVERNLIGASGDDFALSFIQRLLLAGRVLWFYASKLVWPASLAFSYRRWEIDPAVWWQYIYPAGVLAVAIALVLAARRQRGPLAGFLIFAVTLFPVLGFLNVFPFRFSWVADHFQYLACLGIIVPLTSWLAVAAQRFSPGKEIRIAIVVALAAPLGILSFQQSAMYSDNETLYRETLARNPASFLAHHNLGSILVLIPGRVPEATAEFQAAIEIKPRDAEAHYNLGSALEQSEPDRLADIAREFETAVQLKPDYAEAHNGLCNVLLRVPGRLSDAISECQTAIRIRPAYGEAHNNLGNAYSRLPGRLPDAIGEYRAALRLQPDLAQVHANLGKVLMESPGQLTDGIGELEAAVRMSPNAAELHYNLGTALSRVPGRLSSAVGELQAAVRIRPDLAEGHFNLAMLLSQISGRKQEAIDELEATLRLRPDFEPAKQAIARLRIRAK